MRPQAAGLAGLVEDHDANGDACSWEELRRKTDYGIEHIVPDQLLADFSFRSRPEQHAMRSNNRHASRGGTCNCEHMQDKGVVAPALGGHVRREALIGIGLCFVVPPFVKAERRIGTTTSKRIR